NDDGRAEAVHDQTALSIAFGVNQSISIRDLIDAQPIPAQTDGMLEAAGKESLVDGLVRIGCEDPKSDPRMTVIEAAAYPVTIAVEHIDDGARRHAAGRLLDHLLEDPGVG